MFGKKNFFSFHFRIRHDSPSVQTLGRNFLTFSYFEKQNYEPRDAAIGNTKELKPNLVRKILYIYE